MNLSVNERITLLSLLPIRGDYVTLKILTQLRLGLSFTEKEIKNWGIINDAENQRVSWKEDGETEIPIGEQATRIIIDSLRKRDRGKDLPFEAMSVYEKFIPIVE